MLTSLTLLLAATTPQKAPNAPQFYDDAATVIPILLLALVYQSKSLRPQPGVELGGVMALAVIAIAAALLGEFVCLHVAAGFTPTNLTRSVVIAALVVLGMFIFLDALSTILRAGPQPERPAKPRALVVAVAVILFVIVVPTVLIANDGAPALSSPATNGTHSGTTITTNGR